MHIKYFKKKLFLNVFIFRSVCIILSFTFCFLLKLYALPDSITYLMVGIVSFIPMFGVFAFKLIKEFKKQKM